MAVARTALLRNIRSLPAFIRCYSTPGRKGGKSNIVIEEEDEVPVESDAYKLVNYVCGTKLFAAEGEDVKIKPDSEYPDWLWELYTGPKKTLKDMDPNTLEYWNEVRRIGREREKYLQSLQPHLRDFK